MTGTRYVFHGGTTLYANLATDIRVARDLGYDGIELWADKVLRYLDAGFTARELRTELGDLTVPMLDVIVGFERLDAQSTARRLKDCARLAAVAEHIGCSTIQVVATDDFVSNSWSDQRSVLIDSLRAMIDVVSPYGVTLAVEPLAYSPFNSLAQALEVLDEVGTDSIGLCLDTWHLWTAGEDWDVVAALDPTLILSAQLSDTLPRSGPAWSDSVRAALPGDGILPLDEAVAAVESTGYRGHWCVEMLSDTHREWHPEGLGAILLERLQHFVPRVHG